MSKFKGGPGRPSLGPRDLLAIRVSQELGQVVRDLADERDMSINDYGASMLAIGVGRPDLAGPLAPIRKENEAPTGE
jgi:hypothetical protein